MVQDKPGQYNWAASSIGTTGHLAEELIHLALEPMRLSSISRHHQGANRDAKREGTPPCVLHYVHLLLL
jgi:hypothetical protein